VFSSTWNPDRDLAQHDTERVYCRKFRQTPARRRLVEMRWVVRESSRRHRGASGLARLSCLARSWRSC